MILILFLITVLGPAIFWLWFFGYRDRAEPEPKKFLFKIFLLGIGAALVAYAVEETIFSLILGEKYEDISSEIFSETGVENYLFEILFIVVAAGIIEEIIKFLLLREFVYESRNFNQISDGIIYAVTLALGLSAIENAGYFINIYSFNTTAVLVATSIFRGVSTTLMHISAAGIIGYALGRVKYTQGHKRGIIVKAVMLAILLHAAYNVFSIHEFGIILSFGITVGAFFYLNKKFSLSESKSVWELRSK